MQITRALPDQISLVAMRPSLPGTGLSGDAIQAEIAAGRLRPEWTSVAIDKQGSVLGRAMWWGRDTDRPLVLDVWDAHPESASRRQLLTALIEHGHAALARLGVAVPLPHALRVPTAWRDDPTIAADVELKTQVAAAAGLTLVNERWQYQWNLPQPWPNEPSRLTFESADDDTFLGLFAQAAIGSLDVMTQRELATVGAHELARNELAYYTACPGERAWWRVAVTIGGEAVGIVIPSATPTNHNVGYLAVLPDHRGRGYVDELLGHITRFHASQGAARITATTDAVNGPMASALDRAGYSRTETRIDLEQP